MGKIVEIPMDRKATVEEIDNLISEYPDLKRLLGKIYKVRKDKVGNFYIVNESKDVEIGVGLFVAISRAEGL